MYKTIYLVKTLISRNFCDKVILKKLLKSWFHEIFFRWVRVIFFFTVSVPLTLWKLRNFCSYEYTVGYMNKLLSFGSVFPRSTCIFSAIWVMNSLRVTTAWVAILYAWSQLDAAFSITRITISAASSTYVIDSATYQ